MALKTRAELKAYLETGDEPTEVQLHELLDAMVLKSELGAGGDLDPYPVGDGSAITDLSLPDPLPALDGSNLTGISLAEYKDLAEAPSYATSTTFTLSGDKTSQFPVNQRLRVQQDVGYLYTHVKSRSYNAGSDSTTVEITDPFTSVNLIAVGVSAFRPAANGGGMTAPMLGWPYYAVTGGSANTYTASIPQISVVDGAAFPVLIHASNTGAATLNVNGTGAKSILIDGANTKTGELPQDRIIFMIFNSALDAYEALRQVTPVVANHLSTKTGNYPIDSADLAHPLIVPIDISAGDVDITELALSGMSGIVEYVVVADDGNDVSSRKARLLDNGSSEVWTGVRTGDFVRCAYNGSVRHILDHSESHEAYVGLTTNQSISAASGAQLTGWTEERDIGGVWASNEFTAPFDCQLIVHAVIDNQEFRLNPYWKSSGADVYVFEHHGMSDASRAAGQGGFGSVVIDLAEGADLEQWAFNHFNGGGETANGGGQTHVRILVRRVY